MLCAALAVALALGCGEQVSSSAGEESSGAAGERSSVSGGGQPSAAAGERSAVSAGEQSAVSPGEHPGAAAGDVAPPGWTTYRSDDWGYAVSFPKRWQRATDSLTPELVDPREILSLGTFPLGYAPRDCEHVPTSALERMSEEDAFLTIQERGVDPGAEWLDFPARPKHFVFEPGRGSEAPFCVRGPVRFVEHWFAFTDGERHFHVEVALGKSAPPELRDEAYRILDTLRFDPDVRPDWRASG